jgi:GT2 family glycosyltransferase
VNVVAVIVAYNRRPLLLEALDAIKAQTLPVAATIVVDNASTDGSGEAARQHPSHPLVVAANCNTGGAGGFAIGMDVALDQGEPDYLWLMDDDTIPTPTALLELMEAQRRYGAPVDILSSRAIWTDGRDHPMNTPRKRWRADRVATARAEAIGAVPVRSASFVSMLVSAEAVRRHGLPQAGFFIWNDDFEFSARILRDGVGLFVPSSVVEHRTKAFGSTDADPGERFYYEVRNKIWMFGEKEIFAPLDRLAYGTSTLRRWARTLAGSKQRGLLARSGARGVLDALTTRPRPTPMVIRDAIGPQAPVDRPWDDTEAPRW